MKSELKNKLNRLGFRTDEIETLDALVDFANDLKLLNDRDSNDRKIEVLIREKISLSQELAILRKQAMGILPKEDWNDYCEFVQECIDKIIGE